MPAKMYPRKGLKNCYNREIFSTHFKSNHRVKFIGSRHHQFASHNTEQNFLFIVISAWALAGSLWRKWRAKHYAGRSRIFKTACTKVIICLQTFSCEKRYELLRAPRAGSAHIPRAAPAAILSLFLSLSLTSPSASCAALKWRVACVHSRDRLQRWFSLTLSLSFPFLLALTNRYELGSLRL